MNFRRGLLRFWLVVSAAWFVLVFAVLRPDHDVSPILTGVTPPGEAAPGEAIQVPDGFRVVGRAASAAEQERALDRVGQFALLAASPPALVLAFGAALGWALRGFQRGDHR